jgi:hypothetical protein
MKMNARFKRSERRVEALQYLVEAVLDRSDARSAAIVSMVDGEPRVVAGAGAPRDLLGLARIAGPVARGEECAELDAVTAGSDLLTREVPAGGATYYLAAIGTRVRKMTDAARAITRIVATTEA